ncbi:MAG: hypothetical protein EOO73_35410 [Myxococcales bacterium]|nr:MAG: hypothetical protein EOO73_35410 [Myxococcales bacterium]
MSISTGGFSGDNALLAFAAMQQGRMNDELSESMRSADIRSQMAKDIASIKADWDAANRDFVPGTDERLVLGQGFLDLKAKIEAFEEKYGDDPACADMMASMGALGATVKEHIKDYLYESAAPESVDPGARAVPKYSKEDVQNHLSQLQETLDAAGTNDQLAMIHIKQLNDDINNSSGMVSGIIESRQNTIASIINNLA